MRIADWTMFYHSLIIVSGKGESVPKPENEQLDEFERKVGFRLPVSYREYIRIFGPGSFPNELRIAAPGYPYLHPTYDLEGANRFYRFDPQDLAQLNPSTQNAFRLEHLYMFGNRRDRVWLGWDVADIRNPETHEYAIYGVEAFDEIHYLAPNFRHFVESVCDVMLAPDPLWLEKELGPQRAFERAGRPSTSQTS